MRGVFYNTKAMSIVVVLVLIAGSLRHVTSPVLLEQILMADNYMKTGVLYPSADSAQPSGVSPYFPGVALLAVLINQIGIDYYIVESMLAIACVTVLIFFSIQKRLIKEISGVACSWNEFIPFAVSISIILTPHWLAYASEFKPDTIALSLGFSGLIVSSFLRVDSRFSMIFCGALLCSIALVFKQQYISFIVGLSIYCIAFPNKVRVLFFAHIIVFSSCILVYFYNNNDLWFWNVTVLSDDGLNSLYSVVKENYSTLVVLLYVLFIASMFVGLVAKNNRGACLVLFWDFLKKSSVSSPWIWVVAPSAFAAFASAIKVGGNSGNTQLGIILFLPLLAVIFLRLEHKAERFSLNECSNAGFVSFRHYTGQIIRQSCQPIVVGVAWIAIFSMLPNLYGGPNHYIQAVQLRAYLLTDLPNKPSLVLTGSDVYFASRVYLHNSNIVNYWTIGFRDGSESSTNSLKEVITRLSPDRIVVENSSINRAAILSDSRYKLLYENKIGLVAILESPDIR